MQRQHFARLRIEFDQSAAQSYNQTAFGMDSDTTRLAWHGPTAMLLRGRVKAMYSTAWNVDPIQCRFLSVPKWTFAQLHRRIESDLNRGERHKRVQ